MVVRVVIRMASITPLSLTHLMGPAQTVAAVATGKGRAATVSKSELVRVPDTLAPPPIRRGSARCANLGDKKLLLRGLLNSTRRQACVVATRAG